MEDNYIVINGIRYDAVISNYNTCINCCLDMSDSSCFNCCEIFEEVIGEPIIMKKT